LLIGYQVSTCHLRKRLSLFWIPSNFDFSKLENLYNFRSLFWFLLFFTFVKQQRGVRQIPDDPLNLDTNLRIVPANMADSPAPSATGESQQVKQIHFKFCREW